MNVLPGLEIVPVPLGQTESEKKGNGGLGFLTTVLMIALGGAVGYAIGFERGSTATPRSRRSGWGS